MQGNITKKALVLGAILALGGCDLFQSRRDGVLCWVESVPAGSFFICQSPIGLAITQISAPECPSE